MSTWNLDEKKNPAFFSRDKRGIAAPGGGGGGLAGRTAETCMFSYFSLSHTLYPPPLLFFLEKPPKKRLIMKGKLNFTL